MSPKPSRPSPIASAVSAIDRAGALLVFPLDNRKQPASLWSHFHPRSPMRWEWDESGDDRVSRLWHLRSELSTTRQVVYTKWFRGRATYLSRPLFSALLRALNPSDRPKPASPEARAILEVLESESPLSTKELKRMAGLQGRAHASAYEKALKLLGSRLLIVAFGEVDDGAFPSLAIGSTRVLFEDLWEEAFRMPLPDAQTRILKSLGQDNLFYQNYEKLARETRLEAEALPQPKARGSSRRKATERRIPGVVRFDEF